MHKLKSSYIYVKLYEPLEKLKKHEASRVILNYLDAEATDVEALIEDGEIKKSKRIAEGTEML